MKGLIKLVLVIKSMLPDVSEAKIKQVLSIALVEIQEKQLLLWTTPAIDRLACRSIKKWWISQRVSVDTIYNHAMTWETLTDRLFNVENDMWYIAGRIHNDAIVPEGQEDQDA